MVLGETLRAVTWNRISHKTEETILENMIASNREYVLQKGWKLEREYVERLTSKGITPGLDEMLRDAEAHKFDMVVFKSTSRMTRGGMHFAIAIVERLKRAGVRWHFVEQGYLNWDSGIPEWVADFLLVMWAGLDKEYRKRIGEATKRDVAVKKAAGTYTGGAKRHRLPCRCAAHRTARR